LGFGVIGCGAGLGLGLGVVGGGVASGTARICSRALRKAFFFSRSKAGSVFCPRAKITRREQLMSNKVRERTGADASGGGRFANLDSPKMEKNFKPADVELRSGVKLAFDAV
jgi:hypothetical protein